MEKINTGCKWPTWKIYFNSLNFLRCTSRDVARLRRRSNRSKNCTKNYLHCSPFSGIHEENLVDQVTNQKQIVNRITTSVKPMSLWTPVDNTSTNPLAEAATAKWQSAHGKLEIRQTKMLVWSYSDGLERLQLIVVKSIYASGVVFYQASQNSVLMIKQKSKKMHVRSAKVGKRLDQVAFGFGM